MHPKIDILLQVGGLIISLALVLTGMIWVVKKSDDPGRLLVKGLFTIPFAVYCIWTAVRMGPMGPFMIAFMALVLTCMWTPFIAEWITNPFTSMFDGGGEQIERKPLYSIANAKRKRGQYPDAIAEVRKQLTRFPNDYEGTILLAAIQAENMMDLRAAAMTMDTFCRRTRAPDQHVAAALTQLADWHLKLGTDVDSARATLQRIVERFPDTEISLHAEQRIAHLVETEKILLAQHDRQRVVLPEGVHNLGLRDSVEMIKPVEIPPGKLAEAHVKHLAQHPNDSEVREKLALIYARDFKRLDLATMELTTLINESRHSPKQIAGWLNLLANFQIELGADQETVRDTLQKIVDTFPNLPLALVTKRRLARLDSEFKGKNETPGVKLGVYEQNIGLKYGGPRKPDAG